MTSEGMWELFIKTGSIIAYCLYKELSESETEEKTA